MVPSSAYPSKKIIFPQKVWVLIAGDITAVCLAFILAYGGRVFFSGVLPIETYLALWPVVIVFPLLYGLLRLYPGNFISPPEELKRLSLASSCGFLFLGVMFFLAKSADNFSRIFFLFAWLLSLFFVPTVRALLRKKYRKASWWVSPYIFVGDRKSLGVYFDHTKKEAAFEIYPVAVICPHEEDETVTTAARERGIEVCYCSEHEWTDIFAAMKNAYSNALILVHLPSIGPEKQETLLDTIGKFFRVVVMLPELRWSYCIPYHIVSLRYSYGLFVRRNLADIRRVRMKRLIDLSMACLIGIVALPIMGIIALWIKRDSPGPAFFRHRRIGQNGKDIYIFKFRTMVSNSQEILEKYLEDNPEHRKEWEETQKLREDPRITKVGAFLRKTSLDELPQLLNVLTGDMSLVGPRPIVQAEIEKYKNIFSLYCLVPPGITGIWQVSGRSDISYDERVQMDRYYISNWSVWLDIYILAKTVPAVLYRQGAY